MNKLQSKFAESSTGSFPLSAGQELATRGVEVDRAELEVDGTFVDLEGDRWYKISNSHRMPAFFMSLVSSADHWMFIASNGALTAGRQNAESALFPYYSADKILDMRHCSGPRTLLSVRDGAGSQSFWEPFGADRAFGSYLTQNLYKNSLGSRVLFEEVHHQLGLRFRYSWTFGNEFGFIRQCQLINDGLRSVEIEMVDGLQNLVPSGLGSDFQLRYSNLGDAYKKAERIAEAPMGVYYLSSIPTDRAEPSEGLQATTVWLNGFVDPTIALSDIQLLELRQGRGLCSEYDVRGRRGAFLFSTRFRLPPSDNRKWQLVADVNKSHSDVISLVDRCKQHGSLETKLRDDIGASDSALMEILSAADGRQSGKIESRVQRHQSNVLFNVMRGGIPVSNYVVTSKHFSDKVRQANVAVAKKHASFLHGLPEKIGYQDLQDRVQQTADPDLIRLVGEYLPLRFSRRHGDPTRPWNRFSIDLWNEDGEERLHYEGNWRDIFQNWEALAFSYPNFTLNMVRRFVNASTADGYNPYRIALDGIEWEEPDPSDPWGNIGYWGDHQIIYLYKLLSLCRDQSPSQLVSLLQTETFTYADIPYRIRSYEQICRDPQETIDFDNDRARRIQRRVESVGGDGKLLFDDGDRLCRVNLLEKLLVPALTKLTNFVPEGGVWLNTQRPEWNDANNALVGRGLSVVTACHLRRYLMFLVDTLTDADLPTQDTVSLSRPVAELIVQVGAVLDCHREAFSGRISDSIRRQVLDALATAGSDYRTKLYREGLGDGKKSYSASLLVKILHDAITMVDHTIVQNRREDGMYHSYNLLELGDSTAGVSHLHEMLEGQVAVLDSGLLSPVQALEVLDSLRASKMYREDQRSYMLYPDRELPRFLEKNCVPSCRVSQSQLLQVLLDANDSSIVERDIRGQVHFSAKFRNVSDLNAALDRLQRKEGYQDLIHCERQSLLDLFESTFGHQHFTGRSGTFLAYEGLGSIYWHMVSKLALSVLQYCIRASESHETNSSQITLRRLHRHYRDICEGIGLTKCPTEYGAFPSDPYSHTPAQAGVQQPGMTGQVKEDILSRWAELGVRVRGGRVQFAPTFFDLAECSEQGSVLEFSSVGGGRHTLPVPPGSFAFTFCQVPVIYHLSDKQQLMIHREGQPATYRDQLQLTKEETDALFSRSGEIFQIEVTLNPALCLSAWSKK